MKSSFLFLGICLLILSSCEKEDLAPKLRKEAAQKMMGKWVVQKTIDEVYDPLPTLASTKETAGTADDYFDFRSNELVEVKSSQTGSVIESYKVWNPYQVMIGGVGWWIEELTPTDLVLKWDRNDAARYMRFVTRIHLKR